MWSFRSSIFCDNAINPYLCWMELFLQTNEQRRYKMCLIQQQSKKTSGNQHNWNDPRLLNLHIYRKNNSYLWSSIFGKVFIERDSARRRLRRPVPLNNKLWRKYCYIKTLCAFCAAKQKLLNHVFLFYIYTSDLYIYKLCIYIFL